MSNRPSALIFFGAVLDEVDAYDGEEINLKELCSALPEDQQQGLTFQACGFEQGDQIVLVPGTLQRTPDYGSILLEDHPEIQEEEAEARITKFFETIGVPCPLIGWMMAACYG